MTDNATLARSMYDAWNARDFARGAALWADEGVITFVGSGQRQPSTAAIAFALHLTRPGPCPSPRDLSWRCAQPVEVDDRRPTVAGPRVAVCSYG
jgi:hypothetical protein